MYGRNKGLEKRGTSISFGISTRLQVINLTSVLTVNYSIMQWLVFGGCHVKPNSHNDFCLLFSVNLLIYIQTNIVATKTNINSDQVLNYIWPSCRSRTPALNIIFGWIPPIAFDTLTFFWYNLNSITYRGAVSDLHISKWFSYYRIVLSCLVSSTDSGYQCFIA